MADRDIELLSAYLDGELSLKERRALEARLSQDPHLRRELDEMRQAARLLSGLPRLRAPRNFTLDPSTYRRPARTFGWWSIRLAGALGTLASVALVAGVLLILSAPTVGTPIAAQITQAPTASPLEAAQTTQATEKGTAVVEASTGTADHAAADWENLAEGDYISITALPTPTSSQVEATATLAAMDEAAEAGRTAAATETEEEGTPVPAAPLPQAAIAEAEAPPAGAPPPGYEELRDLGGGLGGAAPESQLTSPTQAPAAAEREIAAALPTVSPPAIATLAAEEAFGMGGGPPEEPSPPPTQTPAANERALAAARPTVTAPASASPAATVTLVATRELRGREVTPGQGTDIGPALIVMGLALLALSAGFLIVALWQRRR